MKKTLILFTLLMCTLFASAGQKQIGTFYSSYFHQSYPVSIGINESGKLDCVRIDLASEYESESANLYLYPSQVSPFVDFLTQMKNKFSEWINVAKANNVTDMTKAMDFESSDVTVSWYAADHWRFAFKHHMQPHFKITKSGEFVVYCTDKVFAVNNKYLTLTYYFAFGKPEDIQALIDMLQPTNLEKFVKEEDNKSDLFK